MEDLVQANLKNDCGSSFDALNNSYASQTFRCLQCKEALVKFSTCSICEEVVDRERKRKSQFRISKFNRAKLN